MTRELYIHIGYPKTGTTTLQTHLFPKHSELQCFGIGNEQFTFTNDICYCKENHIKRNQQDYVREVVKAINKYPSAKIVYSDETLIGTSIFFQFIPKPYIWTTEPNSIARKLEMIFGDVGLFSNIKIIITIRKQEEMLKSIYSQIYDGFRIFKETKNFAAFLDYTFNEKFANIDNSLYYYDVVKTYVDYFGQENVKVLVFEDLKEDQDSFIGDLSNFMDINKEEAIALVSKKHLNSRNLQNQLYGVNANWFSDLNCFKNRLMGNRNIGIYNSFIGRILKKSSNSGKKINLSIDDCTKRMIVETFRENNQKLAEEFNLDLKKYEYY